MTTQRSEAHGDVWIVEWQRIGGDMEQEEFHTLTAANKFYDELMDSEDDFEFINEPWLAEGADEKFIKGKTMKSESIEDLRDRSVSSGTLKSEDLIPKFLGVLKTYGKDKYDKYIKENPEVEDWKNLDEETMGWVVDELTDLLNEIAPDGCYFGASEGDGADFGFWSMSNESKKSEVSSLAAFDIEDVVGKKLGWTWDDDKSCLVDKDGTEVDWDESDYITIDPVEDEEGNVLTQVNMWGDGTVEFQDENGESVNWTEFDDATVKKVVAVLGGKSEAKKSEAYNWIAFYFCKDKRTGTEYAVIPQDRVFVVGNGGGRYNLSYLDANGHWDRLSYGYFATSCEPISDPENSKVYAAVKADEDRRIIALTESEFDTIVEADDAVKMVKSIVANNYESKKSEDEDDKGCKGKDCKDDKTKKNEADATFKVGDFVTYDATSDGKEDFINQYVVAEIAEINDDGSLVLWIYDLDDGGNDVKDADPQCCTKLDHFAGMVDANHYYMDGPYKAYKGGWEILITKKDLNPRVYEFIGTMDDLGEVLDVDAYYGGENFVFDEDLKDEVANSTGWDVETTTFADMTGDVGESKQTEARKKYYGYGKDDAIDKEDTDFMWQVAYDWFEDRLPEKLKRWASTAVTNVIDKDSRAYEEIVTMDDYHSYLQKYGPSVIKDIKANDESKQTEGLPPKKLGNRLYRSRADLINKMKTLDAVEITTPAQFNDIHSKQWLHTAGYAMDINGNLVGQTYFGDKDGKWYYATTKTFQGDYLPECKKSESKSDGERAVDDYDTLIDGLEAFGFEPSSAVRNGMFYPYRTRFTATKDGVKYGFTLNEDSTGEYLESIEVIGGIFDKGDPNDPDATKFNSVGDLLDALKKMDGKESESKKSESLTLKQKELKDMARFGQAEDITTISDEEAKALRKKGIETIGVSRGTYGMNGALLRDNEGKKYVITARSSNLFYFV